MKYKLIFIALNVFFTVSFCGWFMSKANINSQIQEEKITLGKKYGNLYQTSVGQIKQLDLMQKIAIAGRSGMLKNFFSMLDDKDRAYLVEKYQVNPDALDGNREYVEKIELEHQKLLSLLEAKESEGSRIYYFLNNNVNPVSEGYIIVGKLKDVIYINP